MTKLLLRLFVRDHENPDSPKTRSRVGVLSGIVGVICNLLLFGLKITVGTISGSVSITADAMNNLSDASSAIVTLVGFRLAEMPADENHPYGHARFEYLSGLAVSAIIVIIGFELARTSVIKILHPSPVNFSLPVLIVLLVSILVKLWLSLFNTSLGKKIQSSTLMATAADSRNDALSTAAVLVAALVEVFTSWQIDGVMGLLVAAFILYSGVSLAKETISPLLGEAASPELRETIVAEIRSEPRVLGFHDLMVHDYGPGQRFASIHVEMDQKEDPLQCHELIDNIERRCYREHNVHLVIHYDPVVTGNAEVNACHLRVEQLLQELDNRLQLHDFRMVKGEEHTNVIFDVVLPVDMKGQEQRIRQWVEENLSKERGQAVYAVITFDPAGLQ